MLGRSIQDFQASRERCTFLNIGGSWRRRIMLGKLSDQVRACHERAAEARRKAEAMPDPRLTADDLEIETTWLTPACSHAFTESLTDFIAGSRAGQEEPQRSRFDPEGDQILKLPVEELFDLLPVALYVCEPDGLIVYYNRHAAKLWGRSPRLLDATDRFCGSRRMYLGVGQRNFTFSPSQNRA
jgi:PAS domain-containing protein